MTNRLPKYALTLALAWASLTCGVRVAGAATFTVRNVNDSGSGSLRQAITDANKTAGQDTINFNIGGSGVHTINVASALPTISDRVIINGTSQPGYTAATPMIELKGTNAGAGVDGLKISGTGANSIIVGLAINSFKGDGIEISLGGGNTISDNQILSNGGYGVHINASNGNSIAGGFAILGTGTGIQYISGNIAGGILIERASVVFSAPAGTGNIITRNYIGLHPNGTQSLPNGVYGILIKTANNRVGDTAAGNRNIVSGNNGSGIEINGAAASGNVVEGNWIGLSTNGSLAAGNLGTAGVYILNAPNNTIGGTAAGARNVISGNSVGISVAVEPGKVAAGNTVQGNYIGTNSAGDTAVPNPGGGINVFAPDTNIGGTTAPARNVICGGSSSWGILIGGDATGVQIQGNYIGTNAAGTAALKGNYGVSVSSASGLTIGGTAGTTPGGACTGACNLISGNTYGVRIEDSTVLLAGNFIGTDASGTAAIPNGLSGVLIQNSSDDIVGGTTAAARNVISGNGGDGVTVTTGTSGVAARNTVQGNYIGTSSSGAQKLGNGSYGIGIDSYSQQTTVGGTSAGAGNVISGNPTGIAVNGNDPSDTLIQGNLIGTDASGLVGLGNSGAGVSVTQCMGGTTIGGSATGARNVISGNGGDGVSIDYNSQAVAIQGNFIGTKINGTEPLGNALNGIRLNDSPNIIIGVVLGMNSTDVFGAGNVISGNQQNGVSLERTSSGANQNFVAGNLIGTDVTGAVKLPNAFSGVLISGSSGNAIGGKQAALRNVISGNGGSGINIIGDPAAKTADANVIQGNYLGTDINGSKALGNTARGIDLSGATGTVVGGTNAGLRNVVAGNAREGLNLHNGTTGSTVLGNFIGLDATGGAALGNAFDGIVIENAPANTIGGTADGSANVISGNGLAGVRFLDTGAHDNAVLGNVIGSDLNRTKTLGNLTDGIQIKNAAKNTIGGTAAGAPNLIAFNKGNGIAIFETMADTAKGDSILGNAVFANAKLGIDLGNDGLTANDSGDGDTGPNLLQNYPVISSATFSGSKINVAGSLSSAANKTYRVEFFGSSVADPSGFGEGEVYLGSVNLTTGANGTAPLSTTLEGRPGVVKLSATATDPTSDTSEFSAGFTITGMPPTPTPSPTPTVTPSASPSPTPSPTPTVTPSASPSPTPSPTPTVTPSASPSTTPSPAPTVTPTATPSAAPGKLLNISTRLQVLTGENVLIGGFIVTGTDAKTVVVRGLGPSLPLSGGLADPRIELHDRSMMLATNDNWKVDDKTQLSQEQRIRDTTIPPGNDLESALLQSLPANNSGYTAILSGHGPETGVGLVEIYDLSQGANSRLANISTRGLVEPRNNVMIGGFILGGSDPAASRVAIRGLGPSLRDAGISNTLADPTLDLRNKDGNRISFNDNYTDNATQAAELAANGLTPKDPHEAGMFLKLQPGNYTVILAGKNGGAGVGLVEIYNLR